MDEGILNRTRLRILFACIFTFLALTIILTAIYLVSAGNLLLHRILIFMIAYATAFYLFLSKKPWRFTAHYFLCCLTVMIWTNVLLVRQPLYVVNLQYCLLVISAAYYLLGAKNGLKYAFAAMLPLLTDVVLNDFLATGLSFRRANINLPAYAVTIAVNFSLILYIHYLFFRSLTKFKMREHSFKRHLEAAVLDAKAQAAAKTNFLNTMSHEIRTPLNAVVGMSNLLMQAPKLPEQEENLQVLHFSAANLMATINEIIDFNNIDNGKVALQRSNFSLYSTVNSVCNTFKAQAAEKALSFSCRIAEAAQPLVLIGDELRLTQVLFHLIGNAIKFTEKGFVNISVAVQPESATRVQIVFSIEDSGIGISKAKLKQVFDPFKKKARRNQRQYQTTLGLTIAVQLLKLHGSELLVKSEEGKGTLFRFLISYDIAAPAASLSLDGEPKKAIDLSHLIVLAVDDEKLNIMVVKKILAGWNIKADEALNGRLAVDMCSKRRYDIILMDINMPVMDGFEAAKIIKKAVHPGEAVPWIIALTASIGAAMDEVERFPFIDDCLLKPFKPEDLKRKIITGTDKAVIPVAI
ncbi:ATP-binding protein [Mucilaginibacter jinjuensis]|uniref:histidine kinase n=1 Tax=Mucilaginibacter jinjuensis TaxID=1176721 RepID=A0ABY7TAX5_9SPHI|nr:ATP-binding protein [Mucilaginibacter jinjuensis]WCT13240.1 ATP-binding protein [Mucilaginibacter jinjuensis]